MLEFFKNIFKKWVHITSNKSIVSSWLMFILKSNASSFFDFLLSICYCYSILLNYKLTTYAQELSPKNLCTKKYFFKWVVVTFARGHFCTASLLHGRSLYHEVTVLHRVSFALRDIFARRNFFMASLNAHYNFLFIYFYRNIYALQKF